jgi:protein-tyrosine phosphatase
MANICRSPALEAALRHLAAEAGLADQLHTDSCGLGWHHVGEKPSQRMFEEARKRGILIDHQSQQFLPFMFDVYDLILAVNATVVEQIKLQAKNEDEKKKVHLATAYSKRFKDQEIPDPYYLSAGFDGVMDMILDSCEGILEQVIKK